MGGCYEFIKRKTEEGTDKFALIEWINYYKIRLSYSYNPTILLRHVKNGTLKKSRLAREIEKR
ncbi:hypothetical protein D7Y06_17110 [Roseburia sp. 1XD42-69]|nr:hypothetical protein D7Y06_17110 [Roseburia sp. 1XD42-69]